MSLTRVSVLAATVVAGGAAALSAPATATPAAAAVAGYQPLAFLVGHCWKGTFPGSSVSDEHCFSWIYGGRFVRDEHVLHRGAGQADAFGESIYLYDGLSGQLQYLYIESAGGYSRGTVSGEGAALVFPSTTYTEDGHTRTYRSRWVRTASDAYEVVTEFQDNDRWVPGFTVHMQQVHD
jgi:hypothetical protein